MDKSISKFEKDAEEVFPYLGAGEKGATMRNVEQMEVTNPGAVQHRLTKDELKQTKPWVHFIAGGIGGMTGAIFTCPLDVVKTRLQSEVYNNLYNKSPKSNNIAIKVVQHCKETFHVIKSLYSVEGPRALFKGLGPNLVGVIPARSINFFTYGLGKEFLAKNFNDGKEATWIHLLAAANAGIATSTATNPIWLIKTRLQLDKSSSKKYKNSWDCLVSVVKNEGVSALYRGLSASYLGSAESTLQWVLYEQMKSVINQRALKHQNEGRIRTKKDDVLEWSARSGAAGFAKFIASIITYPHEVIRTRLRQAPSENGRPKYTGLIQCFKLVLKEEGLASMYGGLTPHLLRTVPNSIIMFGTWEVVTTLLS